MGAGEDDRESPEAVRALILARRRRFIAAAVAGMGIAGSAGCDAFAPPPPDDPFQTGGSFVPPRAPPMGGFGDFDAQPGPAFQPPALTPNPGADDRCAEPASNGDEDAGIDDNDAGMVEPCVCLLLTFVDEDTDGAC